MHSAFLLPYLLEHYHYACFEALDQQYQDMLACFQGIFTLDENGDHCALRDADEVKAAIRSFYDQQHQ